MRTRPKRTFNEEPEAAQENGKTVIRVKRGALRRFDQLTTKSVELPVEVKWDRRTTERRSPPSPAGRERRTSERRQPPPFTWDTADFVVEGDRSSAPTEPAPPGPRSKPGRG